MAVDEEIEVLLVDGTLLVLNDVSKLHDAFGRRFPLHLLPALVVGEVGRVVGGCVHLKRFDKI